jgi:hypothetical protein
MNEQFQPDPVVPPPDPNYVPVIESTQDDRNMALLIHLGGIVTGFIIPLVVWLIKKDQSRYIDDQGKEALNYQINLMVHALVLTVIAVATCGFGILLFIPWMVYAIVFPIIAATKVSAGEVYRYPWIFRLVT